ncbi:efflux RND transporter permease subunit [Sulfurimonas lithotrophica]|uniref:Efflux RND transporter permease subunit n=1 Tax=Sulfurimonas lithotrophica TaxID=2590022 RepID=A0A5P8P2M0_9BACT|nr:efflux RND transporter permease subunit [Sulfurimonas lithotrophica]QFR49983.1 efflux RND transporter permease subunit [Sulfurimonas lithotrophica]
MIIKWIISFFIKYKSFNHLLFIFLIILAGFSYKDLPKEMFPPSSPDKVVVSGAYYSSSSQMLDMMIVRDCEDILKNNPNIENISTVITKGSYHITADILNNHKNFIVNELQNEILKLDENYPTDMKLPTIKTVSQVFPLISVSLYKKNDSPVNIVEIAKDLRDEISSVKNIYEAALVGQYDKTLRLVINNNKIEAYNLSMQKIINKLDFLYIIYPAGVIQTSKNQYFINPKSLNVSIDEILNTKIKVDDKVIYVKDVADVENIYEKDSLETRTDAKNSIIIDTKKAKKGDSIKLSQKINKILKRYKKQYPNIEIKVLNDSSFWIKTRLNVVSSNIIIGLILLFFTIWLFISLKIALVVIIGIPVSFAFGLIGLEYFEHSLNTLSMIGVLLSLGLLVDEAIVVSENIHRHQMLGKSLYRACIEGTYEVMPTLFVAVMTTIVAFLPLVTLSGGLGIFIKIIPMMVIILIVSSFLESFVFLPAHYMLINKLALKSNDSIREKFWQIILKKYTNLLYKLISHKYLVILVLILGIVGSTAFMLKNSKFILFPEFDAMSINITGKSDYNSLQYTSRQIKILEQILLKTLNKQNYSSIHTTIGMKTDGRSLHEKANNFFTITVNLKPRVAQDFFNANINPYFQIFGSNQNQSRTRVLDARDIQKKINHALKDYKKSLNIITDIPQTGVVNNDIEISISHKNNETITKAIKIIQEKMQNISGVGNIKNDMNFDDIVIELNLNNYAKSLGFTQKEFINTIRKYLIIQDVTKITNASSELIKLQLTSKHKDDYALFKNIEVDIPQSNLKVNILDIVNIKHSKNISTIKKEDLKKIFTITASLDKKQTSSREFYKQLRSSIDRLKSQGIKVFIKGEQGKNQQVKEEISKSIIFAFLGILLILTWFFNSFRLSIFSLSVIPLSLLGILIGHKIVGLPLTFSSMLGFVGLIGIIMNDTLLLLKFIHKSKNIEILIKNSSLRLRPILLTSITTIVGLSTLIFFASGESLLMQPLAVSIGFGLLWATIINLIYLPVAYSIKLN